MLVFILILASMNLYLYISYHGIFQDGLDVIILVGISLSSSLKLFIYRNIHCDLFSLFKYSY